MRSGPVLGRKRAVHGRQAVGQVRVACFVCGQNAWVAHERHMQHIGERGDGQILSLELMAIAVGLATFADELKGRQVWIFEDNTAAEAITQKGMTVACNSCAGHGLRFGIR